MRIVLATYGSRGDVQPMLALSLALKSAGHDVLLAGPPEKALWAKQLGCPFCSIGSDVTAFLDGMKDAHSFLSAFNFSVYVRKELIGQFESFPKIVAGADLVVGASLVFALSSISESMGIPYRYIAFTPQLLPSGHHPFPAFKHQSLPRWYNLMTWRIAELIDKGNLTRLMNLERKRIGLKPVRDAWRHILGSHVIVASDPVIAQVPSDVEQQPIQTGYMHLYQPRPFLPELERFLGYGSSPVYAGFGSMPKKDQAKNVPLIVEAARTAGRRVVIGKFWDEPSRFDHSDDVFFIKGYPHLRLFPHMAAVIHHGGAGTTATCAFSGVPQIIVPHALDQYYWGHRMHQNGLGAKPIWRSKMTARKVSEAILECMHNDEICRNAKTASLKIAEEDSLERTVHALIYFSA
jgi:UDP:flavonoid glycosyltransferase YjiC (YdhE family)